jgi:hypothetical protein
VLDVFGDSPWGLAGRAPNDSHATCGGGSRETVRRAAVIAEDLANFLRCAPLRTRCRGGRDDRVAAALRQSDHERVPAFRGNAGASDAFGEERRNPPHHVIHTSKAWCFVVM